MTKKRKSKSVAGYGAILGARAAKKARARLKRPTLRIKLKK